MIIKSGYRKYFVQLCQVCCKSNRMEIVHMTTKWQDMICKKGCGVICQVRCSDGIVSMRLKGK